MSAILYFLPLFRAQLAGFGLTLVLSLVTLAAGAALLGTSGWFITAAAISAAGASFNIFGPSALVRAFSFIRILARYGERLVGHNATLKLLSDIRAWLFGRLFPLVPFTAANLRHGDLVSRLVADVEALDTLFLVSIAPVVAALVIGAAVTAVLGVLLPAAAGIYALAMVLSIIAVPASYLRLSRPSGETIGLAAAAVRTATLAAIEGHRDLAAAGAIDWAREQMAASAIRLAAARRTLAGIVTVAAAVVQVLAAIAMLGVLWFGLAAVRDGGLGGPVLVGLLLAVVASFEATATVVRSIGKLGIAMAAAQRLRSMATQQAPIRETAAPRPLLAGGRVVFDRVAFAYDAGRRVLDEFDLSIASGERIAILGASGAGKSTITALLLRLFDPQSGTISIGGVDLRDAAQNEVHRHVALLAQDAPVFMDSIGNNLRIGRADASDAELWQVLGAARLAAFVRSLPDGLDAIAGETGKTMSVGQARRLCLARTLLSGAEIIVLDEPTSGLDAESETAFLADLATATAGRTVILCTHARLPPGAVDTIYRLDGGCLTAVVADFDAGQGAVGTGLMF